MSFLTESTMQVTNDEVIEMFNLFDAIESTSKLTEKQALYQSFENKELINLFLRPALDPSINFGINTTLPVEEDLPSVGEPENFLELYLYTVNILVKKEIRNRRTIQSLCANLLAAALAIHPSGYKWISRILTKNIRMGFSEKLFSKATGIKLKAISLQLAEDSENLTTHCEDLFTNPQNYIVEPKLDGLRMCVFVEDGKFKFVSRNGKELYNTDVFASQLMKLKGIDKYVLDGEIMDRDWNTSMTIVRSSKTKQFSENVKFNIFDIIPIEDFESQSCDIPLMERKQLLRSLITPSQNIALVPYYDIDSIDMLYSKHDQFLKAGFEGTVIKRKDSEYMFKRSVDWLKLKECRTGEFMCVGAFQGTGRNANRLGYIKIEDGITVTRIGSGFSDEQREQYWNNQSEIVGHYVEICYQEKTKDGRFRFPRFMRVRYDKD